MSALLDVIIPVFLIIGFGYCTVWARLFSIDTIDGLMKFSQNFAIPVLLFNAIAKVDLVNIFDFNLFFSFYIGATAGFILGFLGSHYLFKRSLEDSVAIGFCCLFSNTVMLGLPITERAYGVDALQHNFAIVSIHAPFCYFLGITVMELVKSSEKSISKKSVIIFKAMFSNALVVGIVLGFLVNISGINLAKSIQASIDMITAVALPAALFGMGGILYQYRPEGDIGPIIMICIVSLLIHPAIVWITGSNLTLSDMQLRSAVITAAMAPGINTYVFANMYGRAKRVASTGVLLSTALSIGTVWVWLNLLP
ncbi:MAG: AEC family transporter [Paracoccaceae bacterium]|nr:AEC family transporter [Paracoccaceae bacterium]